MPGGIEPDHGPWRKRASNLNSCIAVGRIHADLALIVADGKHGVVADAAVGAAGIEAELGQAALNFLDFGERRRALAAGKALHNGLTAVQRSPRCTIASV